MIVHSIHYCDLWQLWKATLTTVFFHTTEHICYIMSKHVYLPQDIQRTTLFRYLLQDRKDHFSRASIFEVIKNPDNIPEAHRETVLTDVGGFVLNWMQVNVTSGWTVDERNATELCLIYQTWDTQVLIVPLLIPWTFINLIQIEVIYLNNISERR